ncbi:uncharacterized protein DUF421 [Pontibacter ummariensis]|uniref:YetF C-terminal domain-containing protein n=1 Tax=Pontibacter ummariensis TaxID=1610492 RepID=A0A239FI24_9BACT|nr:YetF domain-containing protein [Pontibacter ummariensis]PRY12275.1 uncharacterized protein DUF421 [Pontibacter ummariensis]SNS55714.1 Protein of unknown function [Pontibacter ummariensis]
MESVFRGLAVYFILLVNFRVSGKRTLYQVTVFDFILMLIVAETTQQAMVGIDNSLMNCFILVLTLVFTDITLSYVKQRFSKLDNILEGTPVVLVDNGKVLDQRMKNARVELEDILEAARKMQGLSTLDQVKYAIREKNGTITIIAK